MKSQQSKIDTPLLVSRQQAAQMLGGVSVATIIRLQAAGRLKPVRLNPKKSTAMVFYRADDLVALVKENDDAG